MKVTLSCSRSFNQIAWRVRVFRVNFVFLIALQTVFIPLQKYPPRSKIVRAVSILTGYLIKPIGPNSCTFTYLSQADPKGKTNTIFSKLRVPAEHFWSSNIHVFAPGSLPKWAVNYASQLLAPKVRIVTWRKLFSVKVVFTCSQQGDKVKNTRGRVSGRQLKSV